MIRKPSLLLVAFAWIAASAWADSGLVIAEPESRISPLESPCFVQTPQPAVFDGGDRELWMWHERDVGSQERGRVRAALLNDQGEITTDFLRIDQDDSASVRSFRIDQAPNDDLWAAWIARNADGEESIRTRTLGQFETGLSPETVIPVDPDRTARGVDVAVAPNGSALVVWLEFDSTEDRIVFRPFSQDGEALDASRVLLTVPTGFSLRGVAVEAVSDTEFVVAWSDEPELDKPRLRARRLLNVGTAAEPQFVGFLPVRVDDGTARSIGAPEVAVTPDGGFAVAWGELTGSRFPRALMRLYDAENRSRGPTLPLDPEGRPASLARPGLAVDSEGLLVATWAVADPDTGSSIVLARRIDPDATAAGEALPVAVSPGFEVVHRHPSPQVLDSGEILVLWDEGDPVPPILPPDCAGNGRTLLARRLLTACGPDEGLCLRDQRFQVEVAWNDPASGDSGVGTPVPLTSDTGLFWFFDADNLELVTKLIDGRAVNGKYWFFYGALSNVGYEISVLDRLTGDLRRYENPPGTFASFGDNRAFPVDGFLGIDPEELETGPGTLDRLAFPAPPDAAPRLTPPLCGTTETQLCLNERFSVTVEWEDFRSGDSGVGETIPLTRDTGSFWFFDADNVELVVKVLDARAVNGHFWVFYGSLTDVGFTLTIRDEAEGTERTFVNPPGRMASDADVRAFE